MGWLATHCEEVVFPIFYGSINVWTGQSQDFVSELWSYRSGRHINLFGIWKRYTCFSDVLFGHRWFHHPLICFYGFGVLILVLVSPPLRLIIWSLLGYWVFLDPLVFFILTNWRLNFLRCSIFINFKFLMALRANFSVGILDEHVCLLAIQVSFNFLPVWTSITFWFT